MDARDDHLGIVGEERPEALEVGGFVPVVELLAQALLELAHDLLAVDVLAHDVARRCAVEDAHQRADVLEVLADGVRDAGILHLHHDGVAVAQLGAMHLPERRRGEGLVLEVREALLRRRAQLASSSTRRTRLPRHRRHRRLHGREHLERLGRQQVVPHAESICASFMKAPRSSVERSTMRSRVADVRRRAASSSCASSTGTAA